MKDNNIYEIVARCKAKTGEMTISVIKNSRPVDFKELPHTEQNIFTALSAQSYVYLDENSKKVNNNLKNHNDE